MKNTWKVALAAVALLGSSQVAKADLTISGATGLVLNPTAEIVAKGRPQIQANYYDLGTSDHDKVYGLFGAVQASDRLEVNGGINKYKSDYSSWDRSGFALGAKYQLQSLADRNLGLAVGIGHDRALQRNTHAYVAATKTFGSTFDRPGITGTAGLRWDRFKSVSSSSKVSAYAGVEVPLASNGDLRLIGEIQSKNNKIYNAKVPYAVGLRYSPAGQSFSVTGGIQRQGLTSGFSGSSKLFIQAGYQFGR